MEGIDPVLWAQTPPEIQQLLLTLLEQNQQLQQRVQELEERLNLNPQNSSLPPSSVHPHAKPKPKSKPSGKKRGGQKGHPKHQRPLVPTDECQQMIPCRPTRCACCGEKLSGVDPDPHRHQVWDIPTVTPIVTEYQQHTLGCEHCGTQTTAPLPPGAPTGQFGPQVTALVSVLSGQFRQSKRQVQDFLQSVCSFPLSLGQVCRLQRLTSQAIRPAYEQLRQALPRSDVANMDETPWEEEQLRLWLWAADTPEFAVFAIARRTKEVAQALLGEFAGVLGTDRLGSYDWVDSQHRQLCWAHLLRDFQRMVDRGGKSQAVGEQLQAAAVSLFHHWHRFREGQISRQTLREQIDGLQGDVHFWLEEGIHHSGHDKTLGQCQHIWERFDSLWVFASVEGVEPTNNAAERVLRRAVIWRKLSYGTQSEWGSRFVEGMLSVIETCRKQGRQVLSFVSDCLQARFASQPAPLLLTVEQ